MVSIGDAFEVIDLVAAPSSQVDEFTNGMRETFAAAVGRSVDDTDTELSPGELITGLRNAITAGSWGLAVDHNEAFTINDQALAITQTHVGVTDPSTATYYTYNGNDLTEGLVGFDQWLQSNHEAHRQRLLDDGRTATQADQALKNLRLVEVVTGTDYALSIAHPKTTITELINALDNLGIQARAQTTEPWPGQQTSRDYNVCEHIEQHLINNHGFEWIDERLVGIVDEQHSVVAIFTSFERGPNKGHRTGFDLGLSRLDINEALSEADPELGRDRYMPTIMGKVLLPEHPPQYWSSRSTEQVEIDQMIDDWLPKLEAVANLQFIEEQLATQYASTVGQDDQLLRIAFLNNWLTYAVNIALSGWTASRHDQLFAHYRDAYRDFPPDTPGWQRFENDIAALESWIADNPNGIERECI